MELYRIPKPNYRLVNFTDLFERSQANRRALSDYGKRINSPQYLPWEKARFITPPPGLTSEEAWYLGRELQDSAAKELPIKTIDGNNFKLTRLDYADRLLNEFDLHIGGHQIFSNKIKLTNSEQQTYLARGIIEEAIASSQLEGANVTRKKAKEMIAENRTPRDKSEWMTFNNYQIMLRTTEVYKDVPLSLELLLEMHSIVAVNTMEPEDIGRWRRNSDEITIGPELEPITTFVPPDEQFLKRELSRLIAFANDEDPEHFIHPITKAIMLHFWVGYLHPFVDGNGRIARAIFYWYLLKKGYWLATYIPISTVIRRAPLQYSDAYVYSEQDNDDFTYFFDYHMRKIKIALDEFLAFVQKQKAENQSIDRMLDTRGQLNERQKQVMHYLSSSESHRVSVTSHASLNNITNNTARRDLVELQKLRLIFPLKNGRFVHYYARLQR